ncbi:ThiF family adenylyltransferase [Fictibacillus sp. 18YEL24]|uniref:ThiF family adenylyltransferase n=1 Tax=Fictibacillus sp. 18YEL24 TaxID=2745875 RepID=UPI0018CE8929|nr:ThiF family adenylyltransferase [Fictibacillus sp. 18YEL24]MBH0170104.1 ThiF family adenylyltransferase [Fictibacillus sp. 18YEL24]
MVIRFKPYTRVTLNKETREVLINRPLIDGNVGQIFDLTDIGIEVIEMIGNSSYEDIMSKVSRNNPNSKDEIKEIISFLFNENYIEVLGEVITDPALALYSRIIPLWAELESGGTDRNEIQRRLMTKKIAVIGCGTIGASIIAKLTSMGVQNYVLIDSDVVEETNLTRQPLFSLQDIGNKKTSVLKQFISDRILNAYVKTYDLYVENISDLTIINDVDLIISSGDGPNLDKIVNNYAEQHQKSVCFAAAYNGHNGKVLPLYLPGKSHTIECINNYLQDDNRFTGTHKNMNDFIISTVPYIGEMIGSIATAEIIKFLTGQIEPFLINKVLFVNISKYEVSIVEIPENWKGCSCSYKMVKSI